MEDFVKRFDKIYCINLARRIDRWEESHQEFEKFGLNGVEKYEAIDVSKHDWSNLKSSLLVGELGLLQTHINIIKESIKNKYKSILIFEDDVCFTDEFYKINEYMNHIPNDWDMIYLGGNHRYGNIPELVNDKVIRLNNTYTTHAIIINSSIFNVILEKIEKYEKQIDVYYADLHKRYKTYCFTPNLAIQRLSYSDIQNQVVNYKIN